MENADISALLRERRHAKNLSLAQLARRVNTSPAALSRYENGWQRFEIRTLRKIATALGCRLRIALEPLPQPAPVTGDARVVKHLGRLFWDKPLTASDLRVHPLWVVRRVLECGQLRDVRTLIARMGKERFLDAVSQIKFSTCRTGTFWRRMLEKEKVACTKKSSRRTAGHFWPN